MSNENQPIQKYAVREVFLSSLFEGIIPIVQADHLLTSLGYITDQHKDQLPIRDYRYESRRAWLEEERVKVLGSGTEMNTEQYDRVFTEQATVLIMMSAVNENLSLPCLHLIHEDFFIEKNGPAVLFEVILGPGDEVLLNESLWSWTAAVEEEEPETTFVAITDCDNPVVIKHKGDMYTIGFDTVHFPMTDEIENLLKHDPRLEKLRQYFS